MNFFRHLNGDQRGAAIVEFALVAPTTILLLIGVFELGHTMYVQSIVNGAMQEAGRDSTIEQADLRAIEAKATDRISTVTPGAKIAYRRAFHEDYALINRYEPFTDVDGDGRCNNNEPFEDLNGNGVRDRANGIDGQGDARDVVVLQVDVTYKRLFPMPSLSGWSEMNTVSGRTFLRNQPFRQSAGSEIGNCDVDMGGMDTVPDPFHNRDDKSKGKGKGPVKLPVTAAAVDVELDD